VRKPNLFIIGAPKCGTTALSEYLRAHPQVFFSTPKEPHFFSNDVASRHRVTTLADYEALYTAVESHHVAIADGSTHYLQSETALPGILAYSPGAKFVVILRSPVDLAYSWHSEAQYSEREADSSFERVWAERIEGGKAYVGPGDPKLVDYAAVASIGSQLRRAISIVGRERLMILFHEDLVADPLPVYLDVLRFIGVEDDGRRTFPRVNEAKQVRSHAVMGLSHAVAALKRKVGITAGLGLLEALNVKPASRPQLSAELRQRMVHRFRPEIAEVERITGRRLPHWYE